MSEKNVIPELGTVLGEERRGEERGGEERRGEDCSPVSVMSDGKGSGALFVPFPAPQAPGGSVVFNTT